MLKRVTELGCFSKPPLPLAVAFINCHQFGDLLQVFFAENNFVLLHRTPFLDEGIAEGITELIVVNVWTHLFKIHHS
jgi:hypothetical protein